MKVAILHDYLNQFGGAERVLETLFEIFPNADLYTLLYDDKKTSNLWSGRVKETSFLDMPFVRRRHRAFIPLMPIATELLRPKEEYDLIISSTAGYSKGMSIKAKYHISYCHTPLRYAWEIDYLKNLPFAPWPLKEFIISPIARWLRDWDKSSSKRVNVFIANSNYIASKIKAYYGRESEVIYPPVKSEVFFRDPGIKRGDYFLMVGRLLYYKGFDLGIKVFNSLKRKLKIIGSGPEFVKLKKIADPRYIEFIPFLKDEDLRILYNGAKALIFPQVEDFGLVAAEAQTCGLPVIAFNQGGAKEIIEDKKTGLLFNEQNKESILNVLEDFESFNFNREYISKKAERFSKENFKNQIKLIVEKCGFPMKNY